MKFVAFERAKQGTGASRRLRITGRTPGIVYGGTAETTLIEIDHNALWHALKKEAFHASVLQMELAGKTTEVLLRDVQYHPYKQLVLHIDFQRIDANTKMKKKVPLHYSGEENSPAVKVDQCLINHIATELEVSCMPKDLPEFIAVDLSNLVKGHSLHAKDITLPAGVTVVAPGNSNPVLVAVVATKAEAPTPQEAAAAAGDNKKKK
jgi:large subunit ribosomal protein L25